MSETEKTENSMTKGQDSCYENPEGDSATEERNQSMNLNESQDFCLVDPGDDSLADKAKEDTEKCKNTDEEELSVSSTVNTEVEKGSKDVESSVVDKVTSSKAAEEKSLEKETLEESEEKEAKTEEKVASTTHELESQEKHSDDEDEIIQCTPPETYSSPKKQVASSTETTNLKRKAESLDEPPSKILRTVSGEDALSLEKKKLEEEETCQSEDSQQEFPKNLPETNVIIAETQDMIEEDESTQNILEKSPESKDVPKEGEVHDKESESFVEKNYGMDKNENLNDSSKLNEAIAIKEHADKSSIVESTAESADNKSSATDRKEKDEMSSALSDGEKDTGETNHSTQNESPKSQEDIVPDSQDTLANKENCIESTKDAEVSKKNNEVQGISTTSEASSEYNSNIKAGNACKSRKSIEVIYDRTATLHEIKSKPKTLVEIDEDGEKIVLDSSQEDSDLKIGNKSASLDNTRAETIYKSCYESKSSSDFSYKSVGSTKESSVDSKSDSKLVNGSSESKRCDTDSTASVQSDIFADIPAVLERGDGNLPVTVHNINKEIKTTASVSKDSDHVDLLSVSENEPDVSIVDDSSKSKSDITHSSSLIKTVQIEKEVSMYVKMKCLLHVDEGTKEFLNKEVTAVHCEPVAELPLTRPKNNDTSASLADISGNDNKDGSPGSVNSNPQLFQLNPSRLSFASTISSLSSASSAASLAAKIAIRDSTHFSLPRVPVKHAKKHLQDQPLSGDKQALDETYERLTREWQNSRLLTTTVLNFANTELSGMDPYNVSNERIDDQLQKIRSSTPEVEKEILHAATPKSTKKGKAVKRPRSKSARSEAQSNGMTKISPKVLITAENSNTPSRKKNKTEHAESTTTSNVEATAKTLSQDVVDELIGKEVFAKWSDNNYYPGTVIDKVKTKYKVNFYDGKNKILIEDFIIPIPKTLSEGLSVYATTKNDDYGSCGIIVDIQTTNNDVYYVVETDEEERLRVQVKDIFLSSDQAQVLKEEVNSKSRSLPSTPKHLGQVTLDNMVDGKRRSRRIGTPIFSTPKSRVGTHTPTNKNVAEPSVSGIASKVKKEKKAASENESMSSDSNVSVKDETILSGIQPEIIGTPHEQTTKGPQSRIKSKSRSKKKVDDEETIATLGPIPPENSTLFKGMSFILACVSLETIDRYQTDNKDSGSDPGTENEEEWVKKPFVRDRLKAQITAGGGIVYDEFSLIPQDEYKNTKLITNVPNTTAKTLLCLSVGIPMYNHNWIIRCCQKGKIVNPAEDELPSGWSLEKRSYIEMFQRPSNKPLTQVVVIIPMVENEKQFSTFWRQICENAGAVVILADTPDAMEGFVEGTVVLTNRRCPTWAIDRANEQQIPLLSSTWIVQCLIEGKTCLYDGHHRYKYNYIQN